MIITFNSATIAPASDRFTKQLGWASTIPPNRFDSASKPYSEFSVGLVYLITVLHIYYRYESDDNVRDEKIYKSPKTSHRWQPIAR